MHWAGPWQLTDEASRLRNENVVFNLRAQSHPIYEQLDKEKISAVDLALICREVALAIAPLKACAVMLDPVWQSLREASGWIELLLPEEQLGLASACFQARDRGVWERVAVHPILHRKSPPADYYSRVYTRSDEDQMIATEKSWKCPFKGDAVVGLWDHIKTYYNPSAPKAYDHYAAIIQSSGVGKSRIVDELAKTHFVIPLNLRVANSSGYPPADHGVRDWLTSAPSKYIACDRASTFLEALFRCTTARLHTFGSLGGPVEYATQFRARMAEGQTMKSPNHFREDFYDRVIEMAVKIESQMTPQKSEYPPYIALNALVEFLQPLLPSPIEAANTGTREVDVATHPEIAVHCYAPENLIPSALRGRIETGSGIMSQWHNDGSRRGTLVPLDSF